MQLDDRVTVPETIEPEVSRLTPDERRRQIACQLAAGVLRFLAGCGSNS